MISDGSLIIDLQYFGNYTFYKIAINASDVTFDQYESHKKKGFGNRCLIAGANGRINLSVPLQKGRSQKTILKDVRISNDENWQLRHWRSIVSSYNNSPWFKYFSDDLSVLFFKRFDFLQLWNLACFDWTLKILKLNVRYKHSEEWKADWPGMIDFRNKIWPGQHDLTNDIRYPQVFESKFGFLPDLSILDLICCEGPKGTVSLLKRVG